MKPLRFLAPRDVASASAMVARSGRRLQFKAGGVDLLDRLKEGLDSAEGVVDLLSLPGLRGIRRDDAWLEIGATTTLAEIAESEDVRREARALSEAASRAALPQIRNVATLGGNLCQRPRCWYFRHPDFQCLKKGGSTCFAAEGENRYHAVFGGGPCHIVHPSATATALVALGAAIRIRDSRAERETAAESFFLSPKQDMLREAALGPGELITAVRIPRPAAGDRSGYCKIQEKQSHDWPLAEAAVRLSIAGGKIRSARVVLGHAAPIPWRAADAEKKLTGATPGEAAFRAAGDAAIRGATPLAQNAYKLPLLAVAVRRALADAMGR